MEHKEIGLSTMLTSLIDKECRIETRDGAIRKEKVYRVVTKEIKFNGEFNNITLHLPISLSFDAGDIDGIELFHVAKITLV